MGKNRVKGRDMTIKVQDVVAAAVTREAVDRLAKDNLDGELYDYADWKGTYDPDVLAEGALEYVDGSAATVYDDEARELCEADPSAAEECARELYGRGWRELPASDLGGVAAYVLERRLLRLVSMHSDDLAALDDARDLVDEVGDDRWGLASMEADEDDAARAVASVEAALEELDAGRARSLLDAIADSQDDEGDFDYGEFAEDL